VSILAVPECHNWQNSQLAPNDSHFGAEFAVGFGSVGGICRKLQKVQVLRRIHANDSLRIPNLRQFQPKTACDFAKVPRSKFYDFGNHASFTICGL
jgi:hypothetical protein